MKRMVVAPHADDETFGCGGLIAKYPDTVVVIVATPTEEREDELRRALDALGVCVSFNVMQFPDGKVGDDPLLLVSALDEMIAASCPDELYLPWPSTHQDHIAVYEAGMRSARRSMSRRHWMPPSVLVYDVPVYDLQLHPTELRWNRFEALLPEHVQRKAKALACYESQSVPGAHPTANGSVLAQARAIGHPRGVEFAEQFAVVREVRR